jgi:hypothetical protein
MYMLFCGLVLIRGLPDNHTMMTADDYSNTTIDASEEPKWVDRVRTT